MLKRMTFSLFCKKHLSNVPCLDDTDIPIESNQLAKAILFWWPLWMCLCLAGDDEGVGRGASGVMWWCDEAIRMRVMWLIMLSLLALHSNGQLVFLSEEERVALSKLNPCFEPCQSDVLANLFSTDISTVYRLGKRWYIVYLRDPK